MLYIGTEVLAFCCFIASCFITLLLSNCRVVWILFSWIWIQSCASESADSSEAEGLIGVGDAAVLDAGCCCKVSKSSAYSCSSLSSSSSDISSGDYYTAGTDIADVVVLVVGKPDDAQDPESLQVTGW